jgi:hypothetical protein
MILPYRYNNYVGWCAQEHDKCFHHCIIIVVVKLHDAVIGDIGPVSPNFFYQDFTLSERCLS